jgi:hypothetical protein
MGKMNTPTRISRKAEIRFTVNPSQGAQKYLVNHATDTYCKNGIATLFKE